MQEQGSGTNDPVLRCRLLSRLRLAKGRHHQLHGSLLFAQLLSQGHGRMSEAILKGLREF